MAKKSSTEIFASRVIDKLRDDERTIKWLARKCGIPQSTLRYQLSHTSISLKNALAIADVLDISIDRAHVASGSDQ